MTFAAIASKSCLVLALAALLSPSGSVVEASSTPPSRPPQAPPGLVSFAFLCVFAKLSSGFEQPPAEAWVYWIAGWAAGA